MAAASNIARHAAAEPALSERRPFELSERRPLSCTVPHGGSQRRRPPLALFASTAASARFQWA
eukprot:4221688-Pleurochrysis_carterae.AAC.1